VLIVFGIVGCLGAAAPYYDSVARALGLPLLFAGR
jgi:hypothetical protein